MIAVLVSLSLLSADNPFEKHGKLRVSKSKTFLEHADGKPFFFLADTVWTGPVLATAEEWKTYLEDRKSKRFSAVQFNILSPWRTAPTDREGNKSFEIKNGKAVPNE